jgi:hypothetical protein
VHCLLQNDIVVCRAEGRERGERISFSVSEATVIFTESMKLVHDPAVLFFVPRLSAVAACSIESAWCSLRIDL